MSEKYKEKQLPAENEGEELNLCSIRQGTIEKCVPVSELSEFLKRKSSSEPCWRRPDPVEIDQKEKVRLWGGVAKKCLGSEIKTDNDFFTCLDAEAKKHLS